jgi:phosphoglycerate dehydrogenase-like enzyme
MPKTKVAVLDDYDSSISKLKCWDTLKENCDLTFFNKPMAGKDVSIFDVLVAVRERTQIDRKFLEEAKNLKHLALTGRLSGQTDLAALRERKISVSYTDGSGSAPTELTIALILASMKNLIENHGRMKQGGWQAGLARSISGQTLGVLGLGRIGTRIAQFGKLMDMKVLSWGPTEDAGRSAKLGIERATFEECMSRSDVISINLRLSEKTKGLVTAKALKSMKDGACLVNTARAEIVDKEALYAELKKGRIRGAFDVFHEEPLPTEDPFRKLPNVLLSPHMGYVTDKVYDTFFSQVAENILAWKQNQPFKNALED